MSSSEQEPIFPREPAMLALQMGCVLEGPVPSNARPAVVALVEDPNPVSRKRVMLKVSSGNEKPRLYELAGYEQVSIVDDLIASAAGGAAPKGGAKVRSVPPEEHEDLVTVMSFEVPENVDPRAVESRMLKLLGGEMPGLRKVAHKQNFYQMAHGAFEATREAAGNPQIKISKEKQFLGGSPLSSPQVKAAETKTLKQTRGATVPLTLAFFTPDISVQDAERIIRTVEALMPNARGLSNLESQAAVRVYDDAINYDDVRILQGGAVQDILNSNGGRAFVLGNTIIAPEVWGHTVDGYNGRSTVIHELMHVCQYQHQGWHYVYESVRGQSSEGQDFYDYGGPSALQTAYHAGYRMKDYNVEKQSMIMQDYYRLINGLGPSRINGQTYSFGTQTNRANYESIYWQFVQNVRSGDILR